MVAGSIPNKYEVIRYSYLFFVTGQRKHIIHTPRFLLAVDRLDF